MNESTTSSNFNMANRTPKASRTLKSRLIPLSATSDPFPSRPTSARPAENIPLPVEEIVPLYDDDHDPIVDIAQGSEPVDIVEPGREVKAETEVQEQAEIVSVASEGSVSEHRDEEDVYSETDAPFSESVQEEEEEMGEDDEVYEGKSMSLRDILVQAGDATFAQYDLLGMFAFTLAISLVSVCSCSWVSKLRTTKILRTRHSAGIDVNCGLCIVSLLWSF